MLIERYSFEGGDRKAQRISLGLLLLQSDFGQIDRHQTGVDMGVDGFGRTGLAIG